MDFLLTTESQLQRWALIEMTQKVFNWSGNIT